MSKKTLLLSCALVLCFITTGFVGLKLSLRDLKEVKGKKCVFSGEILSFDYNQYTRYSDYYFQANINGTYTTLEIPYLYIESFKQKEFEKTYSLSNIYTFVAWQNDCDKYDIIPILGLKNNTEILLNEDIVLDEICFNAKIGIVFSCLLISAGLLIGILLSLAKIKKWFD